MQLKSVLNDLRNTLSVFKKGRDFMESKLNPMIDNLEALREALKTSMINNGENPDEDPSYVLYDSITESTINILKLKPMRDLFDKISDSVGEGTAKSMIEMISLCMTHSAHNAVVFYDELLKSELTKQFDLYGDSLNECIAVVNAHAGVLKILKKRIDDLEKQ